VRAGANRLNRPGGKSRISMNTWWGIKRRVALVPALGLVVGMRGCGGGGGDPGTCILCDDSTSSARPLWRTLRAGNAGLDASPCPASSRVNLLAPDSNSGEIVHQSLVSMGVGQIWSAGGQASGTRGFYVGEQNGVHRNPPPAGTTIEASTTSTGLNVTLDAGSPVTRTTEASTASLSFILTEVSSGLITVKFTSPRGTTSSVAFSVNNGSRPSICPP
jgi:hypothetical protein